MKTIAIVTGGSRGIGAATSTLLAQRGYTVCINYLRDENSATSLCNAIKAEGGKAITYQADVANEHDIVQMFNHLNAHYGEVTHLVNNVGIIFEQLPFTQITAARFKKVLETNVLSALLCSQALVKQLSGSGAIVNVSSAAAKTGAAFEYVDYAASKGAMDTLTKGLSLELASRNVRVNAVRPGFIKTDIHASGGEPDRVDRLSPHIPLGRGGEPEEVANAIAWLLSDEASYITGSFIDLAGGK